MTADPRELEPIASREGCEARPLVEGHRVPGTALGERWVDLYVAREEDP